MEDFHQHRGMREEGLTADESEERDEREAQADKHEGRGGEDERPCGLIVHEEDRDHDGGHDLCQQDGVDLAEEALANHVLGARDIGPWLVERRLRGHGPGLLLVVVGASRPTPTPGRRLLVLHTCSARY